MEQRSLMVAILHPGTALHAAVHCMCQVCYDTLVARAFVNGIAPLCPPCRRPIAGVLFMDCDHRNEVAEAMMAAGVIDLDDSDEE